MKKYKLFIRQYDITSNDYKVREEIVETYDIYHEIGKIYSTSITEIKRIDYQEIDESKKLTRQIEQLQNELGTLNRLNQNNLKNKQILQTRVYKSLELLKTLDEDVLSNMQLALETIGHIEYILRGEEDE